MVRLVQHDGGLRGYVAQGLSILVVAGVYLAAAELGLLQELVRGQVTPLWPPTGIALACLLLMGVRAWPGITLGAFLVNATLGPSMLAVLAISVGNTIGPLCSYFLLASVGFRSSLNRLRDALALVFLGALAGMLVSATLGSGVLVLSGALQPAEFWPTWSVWWTGDAMGVLVITPLLLVLHKGLRLPREVHASWRTQALSLRESLRLPRRALVGRWAEAAALVVLTFLVTLAATTTSTNMLFLVFPLLIWAALRFQLPGATACVLIVSTVAIVNAARGIGPFAHHDLFVNMVILQAFNGSAALTALLLAAIIAERNHAHHNLEQICARLVEMAVRLERGQGVKPWPSAPSEDLPPARHEDSELWR
ncbi:MASE1 domain-containing protein [Nonomuraea sp. bgisy101]|uniref:MASE1 domain-containing protein n=1 Tax=Nonomuraea sp. bgisy101 TaxID=3413784 RepID=UPI003D720000